jgi:23S rRNA (guanosine2251-2'-O)-methyltransferase
MRYDAADIEKSQRDGGKPQWDKIEGKNPVLEALKSDTEIDKIYIVNNFRDPVLYNIVKLANEKKIPVSRVERPKLDKIGATKNHQGVVASVSQTKYVEVSEILEHAYQKQKNPFLVILDGIEDTHNLGAIIRSAECAGCDGVIIPKRRAAGVNSGAYKASAGAVNHIMLARVTNINNTIRDLKELGILILGTDANANMTYKDTDLTVPLAIVIGSEGKGMAEHTKRECDTLVSIPVLGKINSLNASVSAGIVIYEAVWQRSV